MVYRPFPCYIYYQSVVIRSILLNWWRFLTLRFYYFLPFKSILMLYLLYLVLPYLHDFVMRIIIIIPDIIGISWKHSSNVLGMYLYDWNLKIIFEMLTFFVSFIPQRPFSFQIYNTWWHSRTVMNWTSY